MKNLSIAAERLAEAARTLSAASQALTEAAAALSASTGSASNSGDNLDDKNESERVSSRSGLDNTGKATESGPVITRENGAVAKARNVELDYPSSDEEGGEELIPPSNNPNRSTSGGKMPPTIAAGDSEPAHEEPWGPRYHLLLENETDVLPAACQLSQKHNRVICYLNSSTLPALPLYQKLFESITDMLVLTITKTSPEEIDAKTKLFRNTNKGAILLPENVCPDIVFTSMSRSCVIHLGWPSNREQYEKQVQTHKAECSTLVAFSEDRSIYPAGADILTRADPGTIRYPFIKSEIEMMRPHFRRKLAEVPVALKERIYPEWIAVHGPKGRRRVESWSPTTLVYRANLYLLDVLQYAGDSSKGNSADASLRVGLPHVSAGFIAHNGLQSAVDDRVLNVQAGTLSTFTTSNLPPDVLSLNDQGSPQVNNAPSIPSSSRPLQPPAFRAYVVLENDFDIFPYLINLFSTHASRKVICFIKEIGVVSYLTEQLNEAVPVPVLVALAQGASKLQQAAEEFMSTNGALLFWSAYTEPHSSLRTGQIDLAIHLGWTGDQKLRKQQEELSRASSVVLTRTEFSRMNDGRKILKDAGLVGSQAATPLNKQGPGSQLDKARKSWRAYLAAAPTRTLRNCYMQWITHYFHGAHKVEGWDSIKVVSEANEFARRVLLRGNGNSHGPADAPVGGQLAVTGGLAKHLGLEDAARAGLLIIEA